MDVLTYGLLNKKIKEAQNITQEKITEAVNTYLENNPVEPGATSEQAEQIQDNTNKLTELKEDIDDSTSFSNIENKSLHEENVVDENELSDGYTEESSDDEDSEDDKLFDDLDDENDDIILDDDSSILEDEDFNDDDE